MSLLADLFSKRVSAAAIEERLARLQADVTAATTAAEKARSSLGKAVASDDESAIAAARGALATAERTLAETKLAIPPAEAALADARRRDAEAERAAHLAAADEALAQRVRLASKVDEQVAQLSSTWAEFEEASLDQVRALQRAGETATSVGPKLQYQLRHAVWAQAWQVARRLGVPVLARGMRGLKLAELVARQPSEPAPAGSDATDSAAESAA